MCICMFLEEIWERRESRNGGRWGWQGCLGPDYKRCIYGMLRSWDSSVENGESWKAEAWKNVICLSDWRLWKEQFPADIQMQWTTVITKSLGLNSELLFLNGKYTNLGISLIALNILLCMIHHKVVATVRMELNVAPPNKQWSVNSIK